MRKNGRLAMWSAALLALLALETLLSAAAFNVFFSTPESPDLDPPPATYGATAERLVIIQIDGLRRDHAFDPELMPNLCRLKDEGAGGQCLTPEVVMTAICVRTMWTGVSPDIMSIVSNWDARTADDDNFWRQADAANMTLAMVGDDSLGNQFGAWADFSQEELDHGIYNINMSDENTWAVSGELLSNRSYDVVDLHFAGIDHAGHAYTLDSPQYRWKCAQMDAFIGEVADGLDANDTLMVVVDHAQTDAGLHGYGDYDSRDGVFVLWGRGAARRHVDMDEKDVAATTCALMGLPMPVASEGVPRVDVLDATDEEKARILLYAAQGRERYLAAYEEENGIDLPDLRSRTAEAGRLFDAGEWNASRAASESAIAAMNDAYYESRSTEIYSVAPVLVASLVVLAVVAAVVWLDANGPGPDDAGARGLAGGRVVVWLAVASSLVLALGLAEFALGVADDPFVQSPAWRWGVGFGSLAIAAGLAIAVLMPARAGQPGAGIRVEAAPMLAAAAALALSAAAWTVLLTVLLQELKEWPAWSLALLAAAAAAPLAAAGWLAWRRREGIEAAGWGWLPPFALACLLAGMFVKALVVIGALAFVASCGWLLARVLAKRPFSPLGATSAAAGFACALLLAYLAVPAMAYEHVTHWSHTNLDKWPLWLGFACVFVAAPFVLAHSRKLDGVRLAKGRLWATLALLPAMALALAHHLIPDGDVALLDWVARAVLAAGLGLVAYGAHARSRTVVVLSAFVLFVLMASGGQMAAFSALLVAAVALLPRLGEARPGAWRVFGLAGLLLSAIYTSYYALGYTLAFTSLDIRASTVGQTDLVLPYATAVIILKYALPIVVVATAMSGAGRPMRAAFAAAFAFLVARVVIVMAMLETGAMEFQLVIAFTGEILYSLLWVIGAAFLVGWVFHALQRDGPGGKPGDDGDGAGTAARGGDA